MLEDTLNPIKSLFLDSPNKIFRNHLDQMTHSLQIIEGNIAVTVQS